MRNESLFFSPKRVLYSAVMVSALLCGGNIQTHAEALHAQAVMQTVTVKGQVMDPTGVPVIGASVLEKGTSNGVITDIDGNFSLKVSSPNAVVVISYIGYKTVELPASNTKKLAQVTLKEDAEVLDEVVVVGYGVQKKTTLTGAIDQVDSKVLESRAVTNVGLALQGQTPGLTVTRSSSRPGNEGLNFQIRGATSVNGGSPLIVIDGVPAVNPALRRHALKVARKALGVVKRIGIQLPFGVAHQKNLAFSHFSPPARGVISQIASRSPAPVLAGAPPRFAAAFFPPL